MGSMEHGGMELNEGPLSTQDALDALAKLKADGLDDSPMAKALRAQVEADLGDDWKEAA